MGVARGCVDGVSRDVRRCFVPGAGAMDRLSSGAEAMCSRRGVFFVLAAFMLVLHYPLLAGKALPPRDTTVSSYPWLYFARACWRSGSLPLWNPFLSCGYPSGADPQAQYWYPVHWLLAFSPVFPPYGMNLLLFFHYCLAVFFQYRLARLLELGRFASCCAAASYGACGFFLGHASHYIWIVGQCWLGGLLYAIEGWSARGNSGYLALAALCGGCLVTGGYPGLWACGALCVPIYLLSRQGAWRGALPALLAAALGSLIMAAPLLLQLRTAAGLITRKGGGLDFCLMGANTPASLVTLAAPEAVRHARLLGCDPPNCSMYFGFIPLAALLAMSPHLLSDRRRRLLFVPAGFFLLMSLGKWGILRVLAWRYLPFFDHFRFPSLFRGTFLLFASLLAAAALERWFDGHLGVWTFIAVPGVPLAVMGLAAAGVFQNGDSPAAEPSLSALLYRDGGAALFLGFVLIAFRRRAVRTPPAGTGGWSCRLTGRPADRRLFLMIMVLVELVASGRAVYFHQVLDPYVILPWMAEAVDVRGASPTDRRSSRSSLRPESFSVMPLDDPPRYRHLANFAVLAPGLRSLGYNPFALARTRQWLFRLTEPEDPGGNPIPRPVRLLQWTSGREEPEVVIGGGTGLFPVSHRPGFLHPILDEAVGVSAWRRLELVLDFPRPACTDGAVYVFPLRNSDGLPSIAFMSQGIVRKGRKRIAVPLAASVFESIYVQLDGDFSEEELARTAWSIVGSDVSGASFRCTGFGAGRMRFIVSADGDGVLVFSQSWYPGWTARVDGRPVRLGSGPGPFMSVSMRAGVHDVVFEYRPAWLGDCLAAAVTCWAVAAAVILVPLVRYLLN